LYSSVKAQAVWLIQSGKKDENQTGGISATAETDRCCWILVASV